MNENPAFNAPAKIAAIVLFVGICGFGISLAVILVRETRSIWVVAAPFLLFGPIFAAIFWATRRHLRHFSKNGFRKEPK